MSDALPMIAKRRHTLTTLEMRDYLGKLECLIFDTARYVREEVAAEIEERFGVDLPGRYFVCLNDYWLQTASRRWEREFVYEVVVLRVRWEEAEVGDLVEDFRMPEWEDKGQPCRAAGGMLWRRHLLLSIDGATKITVWERWG